MSRTLSVCLLCVCTFIAGFLLGQSVPPAAAQGKAAPGLAGRYQTSTTQQHLVFLDTQTGKCWIGIANLGAALDGKIKLDWQQINTPAASAK